MEINGLPLHVLVVHAAVVFGPVSALSAIAYVALPSWRDRLRWVTLGLVLIAFGAIWVASLSGQDFLETSSKFAGQPSDSEFMQGITNHEELGKTLRLIVTGFAIATGIAVWQHRREGTLRYVLGALVVLGALGTLVYTVMTGDAGSQSVWGA